MTDKVLEQAVFENIFDDEQETADEDKANQKPVDELNDDFSENFGNTVFVIIMAIIALFGLVLYSYNI